MLNLNRLALCDFFYPQRLQRRAPLLPALPGLGNDNCRNQNAVEGAILGSTSPGIWRMPDEDQNRRMGLRDAA